MWRLWRARWSLVDAPWPDHMGDVEQEAELFAAWNMGWFGPFAYPKNLERARGAPGWARSGRPWWARGARLARRAVTRRAGRGATPMKIATRLPSSRRGALR